MNPELIFVVPAGVVLWLMARFNYLFFHLVVEFWAIAVALLIAFVSLSLFRISKNTLAAGFGLLFLCLGCVDFLHAVSYKGMGVFPSFTADQPTQFWILGRWIQAVGTCAVLGWHHRRKFARYFGLALALAGVAGCLLVFAGLFPHCFIEGGGLTPFKIWSELGISLIMSLAALWALRSSDPAVFPWKETLALSFMLTVGSEMAFTLYSDVYGVMNLVGHLLKVAAYWILFKEFALLATRDPVTRFLVPFLADRDVLMGAMTGPSGILDATGKVLVDNGRYFGKNPTRGGESAVCHIRDALPESGTRIAEELEKLLRNSFPRHFEFSEGNRTFTGVLYPLPVASPELFPTYAFISLEVSQEAKDRLELAQTREALLEAQSMASIGTVHYCPDTGALDCSQSVSDFIGKKIFSFEDYLERIHPDDFERVEMLRRVAWGSGKEEYRFEMRLRRGDGEWRAVSAWSRIRRNGAGEVVEVVATFQDRTESATLRAELEASEARYRSYVESSPIGVFVSDCEGAYIHVNHEASAITGYTEAELLDMNLLDLYPLERREWAEESFRRLREVGLASVEGPFVRKDGTEGFWEFRAVPLPDGTFLGLAQDLSEREVARQEAERSQARYKKLFETIIEGFAIHEAIFDAEGNLADYRFLEVNPAFSMLTGLSAEAVLGRTAREVLGKLEVTWLRTYQKVLSEGKALRFRGYSADLGRWFEVLGFPLQGNCFGAAFTDVTEEQQKGEALDCSNRELKRHIEELEMAWEQTIRVLADLTEIRDPYTTGHQRRVAELAGAIGRVMGLEEGVLNETVRAALVHDIGKIQVPSDFLSKPGKLNPREFEIIKRHPQTAADLLKGIDLPWPLWEIVLQHHERMDGSGYPQGLEGDQILLQARIIAVADVVEAMASHRPYRPSLGIDAALEEIERFSGTKFDPKVVEACLRLFREKGYALAETGL